MFVDPYYGMGNHGISSNGLLVRVVGGASTIPRTLRSVDRTGNAQPFKAAAAYPSVGRVSKDGTRLASYLLGATSQLSIFDLVRGTSTRLTYEWDNETAVWSPDESRIAFISNHGGGPRNLHWMAADGSGAPERLTTSPNEQQAFSWSPGGWIAYTDTDPKSGTDIWTISVTERKAAPLIQSPYDDGAPAFSPDGRWIAYSSSQSNRSEIYVQAFPAGKRRWQLSTDGGSQPLWQRDGREIVYRSGDSVMAVPVTTGQELRHGEPVKLFESPDVLIDVLPGGRLLMRTTPPLPPVTELELVVNWFSELRSRIESK
jgi:Tol biopolymer transport system component